MFTTIKNGLKVSEIRKKILFALFVLIVYRLGAYITVPGINATALQEVASTGLASILNTFSGGGLENYSLFAMGVSPYITAQIVVQLLQMDIVLYLFQTLVLANFSVLSHFVQSVYFLPLIYYGHQLELNVPEYVFYEKGVKKYAMDEKMTKEAINYHALLP